MVIIGCVDIVAFCNGETDPRKFREIASLCSNKRVRNVIYLSLEHSKGRYKVKVDAGFF